MSQVVGGVRDRAQSIYLEASKLRVNIVGDDSILSRFGCEFCRKAECVGVLDADALSERRVAAYDARAKTGPNLL